MTLEQGGVPLPGDWWVVLDYNGVPLPGDWPTEEEAVEHGLCGRYLFSGYEVAPAPPPEP